MKLEKCRKLKLNPTTKSVQKVESTTIATTTASSIQPFIAIRDEEINESTSATTLIPDILLTSSASPTESVQTERISSAHSPPEEEKEENNTNADYHSSSYAEPLTNYTISSQIISNNTVTDTEQKISKVFNPSIDPNPNIIVPKFPKLVNKTHHAGQLFCQTDYYETLEMKLNRTLCRLAILNEMTDTATILLPWNISDHRTALQCFKLNFYYRNCKLNMQNEFTALARLAECPPTSSCEICNREGCFYAGGDGGNGMCGIPPSPNVTWIIPPGGICPSTTTSTTIRPTLSTSTTPPPTSPPPVPETTGGSCLLLHIFLAESIIENVAVVSCNCWMIFKKKRHFQQDIIEMSNYDSLP
ncbi:hypothetical protein Fcan01_19193 [Folsomia candida]|uniref:Uncharacterized protein n=1 Tax=Folsomia candida TaxID=158441 RepID=A0A226DL92_FOLCA|nr:hypothetical protein Fcan01_19193 [Folsomia candida]